MVKIMTTLGSNYSLCMATVFAIQVNRHLSGDLKQVIVGLPRQHLLSCFAPHFVQERGPSPVGLRDNGNHSLPWDSHHPEYIKGSENWALKEHG